MIKKSDWPIFLIILILQISGIFLLSIAVRTKESQLSFKKNQLLAYEQKDTNLIKLQEDYGLVAEDMEIIDQALPDKQQLVIFLNNLEKQASESGILAKITFGNQAVTSESKDLKSINFSLSFQGTYFKMIELVKKIEQLPQVVVTDKVIIQSPKGLEGENNIVLVLKCYIDSKF